MSYKTLQFVHSINSMTQAERSAYAKSIRDGIEADKAKELAKEKAYREQMKKDYGDYADDPDFCEF